MNNTTHTITHTEHTADYWAGYEAAKFDIDQMGFEAARDKFNSENPIAEKPKNLGAYYYAKGGSNALSEAA